MSQADPEIVDQFKSYREALLQFMGHSLPAMVPNPDSVALFNEQGPGPGPMQFPMQGA